MDRKAILLDLRNEGKLKGLKPCFVNLRPNIGKIYNGGSGTFIMSIRDEVLHFQKLSFFLHRLVPSDDFNVNVKRFTEYRIDRKTALAVLYLYDKEGRFLQVIYQIGTKETFATEDNISRTSPLRIERTCRNTRISLPSALISPMGRQVPADHV